jgi:hypothetical protein
VISGNALRGISVGGFGTNIVGNVIGRIGAGGSGHAIAGIEVRPLASFILIGSFDVPTNANEIAFNGGTGIFVGGVGAAGATHVTFLGNSIFNNGGLGIKLGSGTPPGTPTPNDAGDADTGANNLQNYPIITAAAIAGGNVTISGTLDTNAAQDIHLEFFSSAACDPSGNGEGQTFLGYQFINSGSGTTGLGGTFPIPPGQRFITATAGNVFNGDVSEFSPCFAIAAPPTPSALAVPTLGGWALGLLVLVLAAAGLRARSTSP